MSALGRVPLAFPAAREANFYLGLAAYDHGDFARAAAAFEFVAARLPLAEVFNLGIALSQAGDNIGATRELRATLEHRPGDAEAKALLGSLGAPPTGVVPAASIVKPPAERIKRNYDEDAFRQLTTQMQGWVEQRFARSDAHAHARFHVERGKELLAHGFATEAEDEFRHARTVDPSSPAPLLGLVDTALARGNNKEARSQAEAALRQHESADAYVVLARLDLSENRVDAAANNLKQAARLDPGNPEVQSLKRAIAAKLAEKGQKP